ncbi:MAG: oligosaccharide flippase family protein [Anaerolineae bacterium]|nr:oligosaccharide flippase family protein [Anaerolineae bacterium]
MRKLTPDLFFIGVLLLLPLLLFAPVVFGASTLVPSDALYTFEPYKSAAPEFGVTVPQNSLLGDLVLENYVWKRFLVDSIQSRQLPLWDPYLFAGHPFLANGQHSALYPLTWLFFILPLSQGFDVFIVFQLGLAGIWMYILARVLSDSDRYRWGAFLAGIAFQFSGFLIVSVVHPMIVAAASWLPLLLALQELTVRRQPFIGQGRSMLPWALLGAVALGLQIFSGHAEITYFVLLVMAVFAAWRLVYTALHIPRQDWQAEIISPALGLVLMVALGGALGAAQFVPLFEIVNGSFRQGAVTLEQVLGWAYPKRRLVTFLIPNFFGNPAHHAFKDIFTGEIVPATVNAYGQTIYSFDWGIKNYVEGGAYLGVLPLLLSIIAIISPLILPGTKSHGWRASVLRWLDHPYIPFFTFLALFSLACIFGTPVYALVYYLPFLSQSHSPFRWIFPLTLSVSVLSAIGMQVIARARKLWGPDNEAQRCVEHKKLTGIWRILMLGTSPNSISLLGVVTFWSGVLLFTGLWVSRLAFPTFEPWIERAFWSLALAPNAFPDPIAFYAYLFPWIQRAAFILVISGIVLRVSRCPIYYGQRLGKIPFLKRLGHQRPVWELLAIIVLVVDLVAFGAGFNPSVDPALLDYTPPVVEFLRQDTGLWRFSTFDPYGKKTFNANVGMFYDFQDVRGYDSLFTAQYARYMGWIEPQNETPYNRIAPFSQFSSLDSPLTDLLNVKYVITEEEIPLPKYRQVYQDEAVRVYENLGVMPRAFTLPQAATLVVPGVDAIGDVMQQYDARMFAIVEADAAGWIGERPALDGYGAPQPAQYQSQAITSYQPDQVLIDVQVGQPAWLILADSYFVGWKAFVQPAGDDDAQEEELSIARVAGNFRGVQLEPGHWTVRFKYSPNSVKLGAAISFLAGMSWLFLIVLWFWRRTYHESSDDSTVQRVAKNSIAPIVLNLFNRVIDFAFAALMLRILGPADAGAYYYAINIFMWFEIISNFGLDAYLMREVACHKDHANRYFFNTTLVRLFLSLVGIPALVGFILLRNGLVTPPLASQTIWAMALLYMGLIPGSISKGLTALFYAYEDAEYPAAITTLSTLLKATLGTFALMLGWRIVGLAGTSVVINLITLTILLALAAARFPTAIGLQEPTRHLQLELDPQVRREMMSESWPLMLNHLMATLFFKVDVILLEGFWGNEVLGWYSTAYKFIDALNVIPSMFTMAVFPVISRQAREDKDALIRFYRLGVKLLVSIALPIAVITALVAYELVLFLGDVDYLPHSQIALQLMIWSIPIGWINSLTNYVLIALGQQRYLTRAFVIGVAFNLAGNILFMPTYGYQASAVITILSELALLIPFIIGLQKQVGRLNWAEIIGKPLVAALLMGGATLLLLPAGRGVAMLGAIIVYPLAVWRLKLLTTEEQAMLSPLTERLSWLRGRNK